MKQPTRFPKYQIHTRVYTDSSKFIQDTTFKYRTCSFEKMKKPSTLLNEVLMIILMVLVLMVVISLFAAFEKHYLS